MESLSIEIIDLLNKENSLGFLVLGLSISYLSLSLFDYRCTSNFKLGRISPSATLPYLPFIIKADNWGDKFEFFESYEVISLKDLGPIEP